MGPGLTLWYPLIIFFQPEVLVIWKVIIFKMLEWLCDFVPRYQHSQNCQIEYAKHSFSETIMTRKSPYLFKQSKGGLHQRKENVIPVRKSFIVYIRWSPELLDMLDDLGHTWLVQAVVITTHPLCCHNNAFFLDIRARYNTCGIWHTHKYRNIIYTVYVEIKYLLYENTFEQFIMVRYFGVTTQTNLYKNQCINTFNDMYVYQRGRCH